MVGDDHIQFQLAGPLQGCTGGDAVIDRDQQADTVVRQPFHHGPVQPIAVVHPAWDRRHRGRTEALQQTHQQGRAGHAVGVVVAADCHPFASSAGLAQALHGTPQLGEMAAGIRCLGRIQQGLDRLQVGVTTTQQQRQQGIGQPQLAQIWCDAHRGWQLPALLRDGDEQRHQSAVFPLCGVLRPVARDRRRCPP